MLRPLQEADVDRLSQLWLHLACSSHPSLPVQFWRQQQRQLRLGLRQSCASAGTITATKKPPVNKPAQKGSCCHWVYTLPGSDVAEGLVAVSTDGKIRAIFVSPTTQRRGAGSALMAQAKCGAPQLEVNIFEENLSGRYFLQQHGFDEIARDFRVEAGQEELRMACRVG